MMARSCLFKKDENNLKIYGNYEVEKIVDRVLTLAPKNYFMWKGNDLKKCGFKGINLGYLK